VGRTEPAERNRVGYHFPTLFACFRGSEQIAQSGRVDGARAYRVHANAAILQVRRPCPRERAHRGFGGAIDAIRGQPFASDDGGIQDDGSAIRHQRKRLLHRKKEAFDVDVEDKVVELLGDRAEGGMFRNTGIGEHDVELALLALDLREQAIEIAEIRHVSLYAGYVSSDLLDRRGQFPSRRPVMKTYAPSCSKRFAAVRPMPMLPPATNAIVPSSLPMESPRVFGLVATNCPSSGLPRSPPPPSSKWQD